MATPDISEYQIQRFWDDQHQHLNFVHEPFNDPVSVTVWLQQGYHSKICGDLCDMRHELPTWAGQFLDIYRKKGWHNIGLAFYRMTTGTVMPVHQDLYRRYVEIFDLAGRQHCIRRALVLLEPWQPGHYLEVNGRAYVHYEAGFTVEWPYDTPHMAANIGLEPRYSLQITGHL